MLIDHNNYRIPTTLVVPQEKHQPGVETICVPFFVAKNYSGSQAKTIHGKTLAVPSDNVSTAAGGGSDASGGGPVGTSDTDNDADSIQR